MLIFIKVPCYIFYISVPVSSSSNLALLLFSMPSLVKIIVRHKTYTAFLISLPPPSKRLQGSIFTNKPPVAYSKICSSLCFVLKTLIFYRNTSKAASDMFFIGRSLRISQSVDNLGMILSNFFNFRWIKT